MSRTRITHEFSNLVREIRKKHTGKGPEEIMTRFVDHLAICELKGNMTNLEKFMCKTEEGRRMIHQTRTSFIKKIYEHQEVVTPLEQLTHAKFVTLFTDFNVDLDVAMSIYVFDRPLLNESI